MVSILFYRPKTHLDKIICFFSRGKYCHVSIKIDNTIYESKPFIGVRKYQLIDTDGYHIDEYKLKITLKQKHKLIQFLEKQIGKGYDYWSVVGFILYKTRESRKNCGKWFCSELVFVSFEKIGINLLNRVTPWKVSPVILSYSPKI